jgi:hypothetical protein
VRPRTISNARKLGLALGLGTFTSLAFCWILVLGVDPSSGSTQFSQEFRRRVKSSGEGEGFIWLMRFEATGTQAFSVSVGPPNRYPPIDEAVSSGIDNERLESAVPTWARRGAIPWSASQAPWPDSNSEAATLVIGRGWPLIALWCDDGRSDGPTFSTVAPSGGIPLSHWARIGPDWAAILPYRPVWIGLIVDSLVMASLWWFVLVVPVAAFRHYRGHLRVRRNHCPHCNYNLAGLAMNSPCPECGKAAR